MPSKPYLLEGKKLQLNPKLWIEDKRELEIGETLTDAAKLPRCNFAG